MFSALRATGNIRAYAGWEGAPVSPRVAELLNLEKKAGLFDSKTWLRGANGYMTIVWNSCHSSMMRRKQESRSRRHLPRRGAVLINYYGIDKNLVPYIAEIPTGLKIGNISRIAHSGDKQRDTLQRAAGLHHHPRLALRRLHRGGFQEAWHQVEIHSNAS